MKGKIFALTLAVLTGTAVLFSGCGGGKKAEEKAVETSAEQNKSQEPDAETNTSQVPEGLLGDNLKIMVIRKIGGDDHTAQYLAGAKQEGEALGLQVDTFSANGDSIKFHDAINQALEKDYDGFIISHGDDAATVEAVQKIVDKNIPVVTFDSNPDIAGIDGVTLTAQDDEAFAFLGLKKLIQDHDGKANVIYLWVDGFPPMVNRNRVYRLLQEKYPDFKEIERFGVAAADTSVQTQNAVAAMLAKHPKGAIDAIWAPWDAFAIGAARAVKEAGRDEIKIYGIDVSNGDLQIMQEENSPWVATAATDPKLIGAVNVRLLLKKIGGEPTPKYYDIEGVLITQEQLKNAGTTVNMQNLGDLISGWGESTAFEEPWISALRKK